MSSLLTASEIVPAGALSWTTQLPAAAAIFAMAVMFIWYIVRRDDRDAQTQQKRDENAAKLAAVLDRNTEALGRNTGALERYDDFFERPTVRDAMERI